MKRFYFFAIILISAFACQDNTDVAIFDKTPDERTAEAIASLKADLVAPDNGWKVKYQPTPDAGSFYVLLNFKEDNQLIIQSDLGARDGKFFQDTLTYRIDSSLGLELIFETYSMFSFLFEQYDATFEAEFEFLYVNKTSDNALVFKSKTDATTTSTTLVLEEATSNDLDNLLGTQVSTNLNLMLKDLNLYTPSLKVTFQNKDLVLYASMNDLTRNIEIPTVSKKSNTNTTTDINYSSGYYLRGDSIVFEKRLSGTFLGVSIDVKGIKLSSLTDSQINVCASPIPTHAYSGITSSNDAVSLETSLFNASGKTFATRSDFYLGFLDRISLNGTSAAQDIQNDIPGVLAMQLYYNYDIGSPFYAIGFVIQNSDNSITYALREFTPVLNGNNITWNLSSKISVFGNTNPDADITKINTYIDGLAQGDKTYVFRLNNDYYEFYNPCSGWDVIFQAY